MLRIRQTKVTDGKEIETGVVEIPLVIESQGGPAIDAYVAASPTKRAELVKRATPPDPAPVPAPSTQAPAEESV